MPKHKEEQSIDSQGLGRPRAWVDVLFVIGAVTLDWYCASEWFSGRFPLFSVHVLRATGLIGGFCALGALVAFCAVRRAKPRDVVAFFYGASLVVSGTMLIHWAAFR